MGKRMEELCYELYGSWKQHDPWQRYAMVRELRELMKRPKASGSDHFERSGEDRRFGGGQFREGADDDDETDLLWKKENPEDSSLNDKQLVETEVATEPIETEDGPVKREANLEEESMPQVPVSDLEHGLRIHNASSIVCEDSQYVGCEELCDHQKSISQVSHVKKMEEFPHQSTNGNGENIAHQVFGKMSQHETLGIKKKTKWFKSWRFKFKQRKQQRDKLRSAHQLIHRGNVVYKYLCSSAKVALMKKNQLSITWSMLKDDCFIEDDQVSHETIPLWLLVRFKFWKFKFMNRKLQKMMREYGYSSYLKLKSDVGEDDEMFTGAKAVSMRFLLGNMLGITESDASQGQQAVFEKIVMMNEWLQPSLVIEQVMRDKKIKFTKQWMFKFRKKNIDQWLGGYNLSATYLENKKTWMFKYKVDEEDQEEKMLQDLDVQPAVSANQVSAIFQSANAHGMITRGKDGSVKTDLRYSLLAVQRSWEKEIHDVEITEGYYVLQEEFEQIENHTPCSVIKLERPQDHDALLLPLPSDERFHTKHSELLVIVLEWVDTKGGFGLDKKPLHLSLRNRVWDPGGCISGQTTFLLKLKWHC